MLQTTLQLIEHLRKERSQVRKAPVAFATAMALVGGLALGAAALLYSYRLDSLNERLRLKDDQLADYKTKLAGATPEEAKARLQALEDQVQRLSPRHLTAEQQAQIARIVTPLKGRAMISADAAVSDARMYANSFASAFTSGGWIVSTPLVMGVGLPPKTGLAVRVRDAASLTALQRLVEAALDEAHVPYDLQPGIERAVFRDQPEPDVELVITSR